MQCTCGAQLPDDARFCLRCGKPQWEEDIARLREQEAPAAPATPEPAFVPAVPSLTRIDFGNKRAVWVSISVAMLTLFVFTAGSAIIPGAALILPLFAFSGFTATRWYIKQTGDVISPQAGARLGFMTALWAFLVVTLFSVAFAVLISNPELRGEITAVLSNQQGNTAQELAKMLENPRQSILIIMSGLLVNFCLFTFPSMVGGMLGVRFSGKR